MINIFLRKKIEYLNHKNMSFPDTSRDFSINVASFMGMNLKSGFTIKSLLDTGLFINRIEIDRKQKQYVISVTDNDLEYFAFAVSTQNIILIDCVGHHMRETANSTYSYVLYEILDNFDHNIHGIILCDTYFYIRYNNNNKPICIPFQEEELINFADHIFPTAIENIIHSYIGSSIANTIMYMEKKLRKRNIQYGLSVPY